LRQEAEAQKYLDQALSTAAQLGYDHFLVNATRSSPEFSREIAQNWENKHLQAILRQAAEFQTGYQSLITREAEQKKSVELNLQVQSLGISEIHLNAEIVPLGAWQSAGARALFYFTLDRHKVKRDEIAVEFWPEFSNAKVNSNFHATLWRVRNALHSKQIIVFDGEYYSINDQVTVFYDVFEFEEIITRLAGKDLADIEFRNLSQQALELYRGDFLTDIDMSWVDARRNELQEKYLRLIVRSAEFETEYHNFESAKNLYIQAIAIDPYQDYLHLALMKCMVEMKAPAAAKAHYHDYLYLLREDLGIKPLRELQDFYNSI
jgi:two-component SAPR family response regulator